jgi:hypothetical protein
VSVTVLFYIQYLIHGCVRRLMVRDGLLSPNSRLLPTSTRRRDGRSDSVMTIGELAPFFVVGFLLCSSFYDNENWNHEG